MPPTTRSRLDDFVRAHVDAPSPPVVLALALLAGASWALEMPDVMAGRLPPAMVVAVLVGAGGYVGLLLVLLHATSLWLGGRILGGTGRWTSVFAAVAWAGLPSLAACAFRLATLPLVGSDALEVAPRVEPGSGADAALSGARGLATFAGASLHALLTYVLAARVHRLTPLRTFAGGLLGALLVAAPVVAAAVLLADSRP